MTIRSGLKDLSWSIGGALVLMAIVLLVLHFHQLDNLAARSAFRAARIELVGHMRTSLASAAEAEKSAVMATTDEESRKFAEEARAGLNEVGRARDGLDRLLPVGGNRGERDLLAEFSRDLVEYQRIDSELLDLAIQNTNLKASALAFGPATDALLEMDAALTRILRSAGASATPATRHVMLPAAEAQGGALRILALLPPHIAEESDAKMDTLEARMAGEDQVVRARLGELATRLGSHNADLETARASYARFGTLRTQIVALSRQNTNVRSVIISLDQKRKATLLCQEALVALEQAIRAEPPGDRPMPANPR